jgi:ubiquitin carboxyl-terminal hydrolase L3
MDGFKVCPVDHGACGEEELLGKASEVIQQFMARDPDNIQFSMLVLAKNPEE